MTFSGCLGSIDAPPHFSHIEIDLHYTPLAPDIFYEHSKICLQAFSDEVAGRQQEHILGPNPLKRNAGAPSRYVRSRAAMIQSLEAKLSYPEWVASRK